MTGVSIRRSFLLSNFLNTARHRITNRQQVFGLGIGRYNETCHNIVTKYIFEWEAMVTRARRWIDFKNDYKTMDLNFM
jgi:acyl-CoA oxidase